MSEVGKVIGCERMNEERKARMFYAIHWNEIVETIGYATQHKEAWWCPKLGWTMWIGKHLFDTYDDAKKALIIKIDSEIVELNKAKNLIT